MRQKIPYFNSIWGENDLTSMQISLTDWKSKSRNWSGLSADLMVSIILILIRFSIRF